MKTSIWDILTGLTLLGILCLVGVFMLVAVNPGIGFNPLKPPATVSPLILPSATATEPGLPPTWTPVPRATDPNQPQPAALPTLRPSSTPEPTATRVILPTFTPSLTVRITTVSGGGGGGGSGGGMGGGNCDVVYQNPTDDTVYTAGTDFDMRWTLKNTSKESWRADSVDVSFVSGTDMHLGSNTRDLPYDVSSGGAVDILVDMEAPDNKGSYTSNWALMKGSTSVCRFFVVIKVQ